MGNKSEKKSDKNGSMQSDQRQTMLFDESTGTEYIDDHWSRDSHNHGVTSAAPSSTEPTAQPPCPDRLRDMTAELAPAVNSFEPAPREAETERTLKISITPASVMKSAKKILKREANSKVGVLEEETLECCKSKGRESVDISPTSIVVEESLEALMTNKLTGLFKLRLPLLPNGAKRFADMLRIHLIKRKNKHVCVGGYIALQVVLASDNTPATIAADLHSRVTKEDIAEWAATEARLVPLIFRLQQEQENTEERASNDHRSSSDLFTAEKPRRKRTRRDEAFTEDLVDTFQSDTGRQLVREPANNKEWAETLRESERTITTRMQRIRNKRPRKEFRPKLR